MDISRLLGGWILGAAALVAACSSNSATASGPDTGADPSEAGNDSTPEGGATVVYTVLVRAPLKNDAATSQMLHDQSVNGGGKAAAQSLGDVGHSIFLAVAEPTDSGETQPIEFLAIDRWTSLSGLQSYVQSPQIVQVFGELFAATPDVTTWTADEGWATWGKLGDVGPANGTRYLATVTGTLKADVATSESLHNQFAMQGAPVAQQAGDTTHFTYGGSQDATSFLATDMWTSATAPLQVYGSAPFVQFDQAFYASAPSASLWVTTTWAQW